MEKWTKLEPIFILFSLVLGYLTSFIPSISTFCANIGEPLVAVLLFFIFLEIDWSSLKSSLVNKKFLSLGLIINFVWTPLLVIILGKVFFSSNPIIQTALFLLLVMPCTDWYLIFTNLTGGNVSLAASILPFNLILQFLLLPIFLLFFFKETISLGYFNAIETILELLIPLAIALFFRFLIEKVKSLNFLEEKIHSYSDKAEFVLVCIIAFAIFSSEGSDIINVLNNFPLFVLVLTVFYILNFTLSFVLGNIFDFNKEDIISLVFTTTSRNTPLSLTLAGILFPETRLISLLLLVGPLTEIPFSLIESFLLKLLTKNRNKLKY